MTFKETSLAGAFLIEPKIYEDERGFFTDTFLEKTFAEKGLACRFVQSCVSFNKQKGTLRGMHYQLPPKAQPKLVRCARGSVYDVIVDLRPDSPTYRRWFGAELNEKNRLALYIPEGMAHGFQTIEDNTEIFYQIAEDYAPELARGARWDDPAFGIRWPLASPILSERDASYPDFQA